MVTIRVHGDGCLIDHSQASTFRRVIHPKVVTHYRAISRIARPLLALFVSIIRCSGVALDSTDGSMARDGARLSSVIVKLTTEVDSKVGSDTPLLETITT